MMSLPNPQNLTKQSTPGLQHPPQPLGKGSEGFTYKDYYKWMNEQLTMRMPSLAIALLGNPTCKGLTEWRYGKKKHLVVHIAGQWQGRFHDFETGESGDALNLVQTRTGYSGKALSDWVKAFIGYVPQRPQQEKQEWKPITPVPQEVLNQAFEPELTRSLAQKEMQETARYCYRDLEGGVLGFVVRFEGAGSKLTLPLTYCQNDFGERSWRWKGFPTPRIPYGAEALKDSTNTILIVEGEKTAEAAKRIFPALTVLTWVGGTGSMHLTQWGCLKGRDVILWPDNDDPGLKCMDKLKAISEKIGAQSVKIVHLPSNTPQAWDLADTFPEGWDRTSLDCLLHEAV